MLVQGQIHLDDLDAKLTTEQARYQELRTQVAEAESPARVVGAAEQLGMVSPQDLVYLQPDAQDATDDAASGASASPSDGSDDVVSGADSTWSVMKPLLEMPAQ